MSSKSCIRPASRARSLACVPSASSRDEVDTPARQEREGAPPDFGLRRGRPGFSLECGGLRRFGFFPSFLEKRKTKEKRRRPPHSKKSRLPKSGGAPERETGVAWDGREAISVTIVSCTPVAQVHPEGPVGDRELLP